MLFDSKSYIPKKLRSLVSLRKEIQGLLDTTLWKQRGIIKTFEAALPLLVGYSIEVSKPNDKSRLTE